jgi:membrane protein
MPKAKPTVLGQLWLRARQFLEEIPLDTVGARPIVSKLRTAVQFLYLVVRGCTDNRFPMRAAALSFTTLLALVPLLAVAFSFAKSFLRESSADFVPKLLDKIVVLVAPQLQYMPLGENVAGPVVPGQVVVSAQARQQAVEQIQQFLANIDAGALGTVGTIFLAVVAIRLLMTIEHTFNDIWGVARGRSIWRKVVYYWTSVTMGPLLLVAAIVFTGASEFSHFVDKLHLAPWLARMIVYAAPFVLLWVGFSAMYGLMPNTQVRASAAIAGGIVGGTLWQLNNLLSTLYLSRVVTYSKIYGSLGIVPVFLVGLYFSWLIVLFGAQVSFAVQNVRSYLLQRASERIDQAGRELIACRAVLSACQAFLTGQKPPSAQEIADRIGAPVHLLNRLANRLTEGGILRLVNDQASGLIPARPPEAISVTDVLQVTRTVNGVCGEEPRNDRSELMSHLLGELDSVLRNSPSNARFSDLVAKMTATRD